MVYKIFQPFTMYWKQKTDKRWSMHLTIFGKAKQLATPSVSKHFCPERFARHEVSARAVNIILWQKYYIERQKSASSIDEKEIDKNTWIIII